MVAATAGEDLFVTSIGATVEDLWNHRHGDNVFFTTVLGSVSSTALGLALALPHRRVIAVESDGSVLMNTGAMCTLGAERPANLTVVVMDNGIYENIGGQPTHTSRGTDLAAMARAAGCPDAAAAHDPEGFARDFARMLGDGRLGYLVARIAPGVHPWPPDRKKRSDGIEDKYRFLRYVERLEGIRIH
jgi:thiamine pyrophosphate-dependent acetolactate synthase large subunit-like protein